MRRARRIGPRSAIRNVVIEAHLMSDSRIPPVAQAMPHHASTPYPFVPMPMALTLLRAGVAALFMAHAAVRVLTPGSVAQFGQFMEHAGFPQGVMIVIALTVFELLGGVLLMLGVRTRLMASGFSVILLVGIVIIHRHLGWFVGEHGTGGSEYSVALLLALVVIMAADATGADRMRGATDGNRNAHSITAAARQSSNAA
jgi:putative oxidoreductase